MSGLQYRLNGGDESSGRVEIEYDGKWGTVCNQFWNASASLVFCRQLGFVDGYKPSVKTPHNLLPSLHHWLNGVFCMGTEENLLNCLNSGFGSTFLSRYCNKFSRPTDVYLNCYNTTISKFCFGFFLFSYWVFIVFCFYAFWWVLWGGVCLVLFRFVLLWVGSFQFIKWMTWEIYRPPLQSNIIFSWTTVSLKKDSKRVNVVEKYPEILGVYKLLAWRRITIQIVVHLFFSKSESFLIICK